MSGGDGLLTCERDGSVAVVRLARGDGLNALSQALMAALRDKGRELAADPSLSAVILTGTDKFFSAGADLKDPAHKARAELSLVERREALKLGPDMCRAWADIEAVTIAAVEGFCIGGGVALAASCDFRIVGAGATFRLPEIPLGMNMSWRSIPRLTGLIGPARTKELTLFGEAVDAEKALRWGLADERVPAGQALAAARRWADKAAHLPPIAARMAKQAIDQAAYALSDATSYADRDQYALATQTDDYKEAIVAFYKKREPKFTGN